MGAGRCCRSSAYSLDWHDSLAYGIDWHDSLPCCRPVMGQVGAVVRLPAAAAAAARTAWRPPSRAAQPHGRQCVFFSGQFLQSQKQWLGKLLI